MKVKKLKKMGIYLIIGIVFIIGIGLYITQQASVVKFRTSNLYYGAESLIAYTESCRNVLTKYGENGEYGTLSGSCNSAKGIGNIQLTYLFDVPGKVTSNGVDDDSVITSTYLYKDINGILYVCSDFVSGGYHLLIYKTGISKIGYDVSDVPDSVVPTMEVRC